jgi:Putative inner membrane protein (DUF1819)
MRHSSRRSIHPNGMPKLPSRYSATLTGGALMLPESRRIAALLLQAPSSQTWLHAIRVENLLQKNTAATALRQAKLIRARLAQLPPVAWQLVATGSHEAATQTLFAAAVLHSMLLADFLRQVVATHHRRLDIALSARVWNPFLADCAAHESAVGRWTASTRQKLYQVIVHMLVEARYIESARTLRLRLPDLHPDVRHLLQQLGDTALIDTLELRT